MRFDPGLSLPLPFPKQALRFKSFENTVVKGELSAIFIKLSSANSFSLEESKICRLENC